MSTFNLGKGHDAVLDAVDDFGWVICTVTGTILIEQQDGSTLTWAAPIPGVWIPCDRGRMIKTGTTATGIMVV